MKTEKEVDDRREIFWRRGARCLYGTTRWSFRTFRFASLQHVHECDTGRRQRSQKQCSLRSRRTSPSRKGIIVPVSFVAAVESAHQIDSQIFPYKIDTLHCIFMSYLFVSKWFHCALIHFFYLFRNYAQILQILSVTLSREDHNLVLDNICAAIARLIIVNIGAIPMDQVRTCIL